MSPMRPRCTPSGLTARNVRSWLVPAIPWTGRASHCADFSLQYKIAAAPAAADVNSVVERFTFAALADDRATTLEIDLVNGVVLERARARLRAAV